MIPYIMVYKMTKDWDRPELSICTGGNLSASASMTSPTMPGGLIGDASSHIGGIQLLLRFVESVIDGTNSRDAHYCEGNAAQVVQHDGKKMLKIFFHLTDDYEPYYIDPKEFKELLEIWIKEKAKFDQDPEKYKEELRKSGGIVIEDNGFWDKIKFWK